MRILHLSDQYPPVVGGIEAHVAGLAGTDVRGTLVGQSIVNDTLAVAVLGLAAGSVLYVVIELLAVARRTGSRSSPPGASWAVSRLVSPPTGSS